MRAGVKQIKNTMNVPQDVLDLLELTTPTTDTAATVAAQAPVLRVKMDGIHPSVGGAKSGFDALEIHCCRTGEKAFTHPDTVTHLPYFDNRPNGDPAVAEQRDYYAFYLKKKTWWWVPRVPPTPCWCPAAATRRPSPLGDWPGKTFSSSVRLPK